MAFEQPESEQALLDLIDQLRLWLADNPELERTFAFWIRAVLLRQKRQDLVLPKVQDLKELKMTLAHRLDQWEQAYEERGLKRGRTEGRTEGRAEGESDFLRRLLVHRFGPLPKELLARMSQASSEQLELWGLRVLDARSLDEVFAA